MRIVRRHVSLARDSNIPLRIKPLPRAEQQTGHSPVDSWRAEIWTPDGVRGLRWRADLRDYGCPDTEDDPGRHDDDKCYQRTFPD